MFWESIIYVTKKTGKRKKKKKKKDRTQIDQWPETLWTQSTRFHPQKKGSIADFKGWKRFATFAECCSCEKCSSLLFAWQFFGLHGCFFSSATLWVCFCWLVPSAQESNWPLPDLIISLYSWFFANKTFRKCCGKAPNECCFRHFSTCKSEEKSCEKRTN